MSLRDPREKRYDRQVVLKGRPPTKTYVRGIRLSARDDDRVYAYDGMRAIRMHLRPRRTRFTPSASMTGQGESRNSIF